MAWCTSKFEQWTPPHLLVPVVQGRIDAREPCFDGGKDRVVRLRVVVLEDARTDQRHLDIVPQRHRWRRRQDEREARVANHSSERLEEERGQRK